MKSSRISNANADSIIESDSCTIHATTFRCMRTEHDIPFALTSAYRGPFHFRSGIFLKCDHELWCRLSRHVNKSQTKLATRANSILMPAAEPETRRSASLRGLFKCLCCLNSHNTIRATSDLRKHINKWGAKWKYKQKMISSHSQIAASHIFWSSDFSQTVRTFFPQTRDEMFFYLQLFSATKLCVARFRFSENYFVCLCCEFCIRWYLVTNSM